VKYIEKFRGGLAMDKVCLKKVTRYNSEEKMLEAARIMKLLGLKVFRTVNYYYQGFRPTDYTITIVG
jgi:hypothetical protein